MSNEIDHIENLERRLYARDPDSVPKQKFGILRPLKDNVDSNWGQTKLEDKKDIKTKTSSGYKRLFIVSFIFFLVALGVALFSVYRGAVILSSKNVEVTILGNSFVSGGEALPIQVDMVNKNSGDLVDANLTLSYPKGSIDNNVGDVERTKRSLGTISSGKTKSEEFSVVLYGEQGTSREITATLEYKLAGSNATFVKTNTFSVMINSSPVALTVDAPSGIASNQPFTINIKTVFTGDSLLNNAIVRVDYPNGYAFASAIPAPDIGSNTWSLGDMVKGTERSISIKGRLIGDEQEEKSFRIYVGSRTSETDPRIAVSYNSTLKTIKIAQPFMSGQIVISGNTVDDIVALQNGSSVSGVIKWKNNAPITIIDPVFTLSLVGDNIDTDSIKTNGGYYDKNENTITWNNQTNLNLLSLEPGASGELPFSFNTKSPTSGVSSDINLALSEKGTYPDRDYFEDSVSGIDQKTIRFASRLQFASQAVYSVGPIKNTGPFPPKVDQDTTYTLQWFMRPVENPLSNVIVSATLPLGVVWTGVISPQSETITYVPETRVVTWNIGNLPKATATPVVKTVSFQVKTRPTKLDIGSPIDLLGKTEVRATDTVVNVPLSDNRPALTNKLYSDPIYSTGKEKVIP